MARRHVRFLPPMLCCLLFSLSLMSAPAPVLRGKPAWRSMTNSIGMRLMYIPEGRFTMGSPVSEVNRSADEGHQRIVKIPAEFYMGVYEVTQEEYRAVLGKNPSWFSPTGKGKAQVAGLDTGRFPVESVDWFDAVLFCNKLGERPGEKGRTYRLPTEAEWEYACRAGTRTATHFGDKLSSLQAYSHSASVGRR